MSPVTIKRSPIVFIRTFVMIEVVALALYVLATTIDQYKILVYSLLPLSRLLTYQAFKFPFLSAIQFVITVFAFVSWHYESFTARTGELTHQWGVLFKKHRIIPLEKPTTVTVSSSPLGKLLHYGSIRLRNRPSGIPFALKDISRPQSFSRVLERCIDPHAHTADTSPDIPKLLTEEEHEQLEFKSSLRFDHKNGRINRDLEKAAIKTVAAFLNSHGGRLVIGVTNTRTPIGLESDYKTLQHQNRDGFENHFTQVFNTSVGPEFRQFVKLQFHPLEGKEICVVNVVPSTRPVYARHENNEEYFYVRTGNTTTPLPLSKMQGYIKLRWPAEEA